METRRKFSREFKLEAVKMVVDRGVALKQAARDLDLNENSLHAIKCSWFDTMAKLKVC